MRVTYYLYLLLIITNTLTCNSRGNFGIKSLDLLMKEYFVNAFGAYSKWTRPGVFCLEDTTCFGDEMSEQWFRYAMAFNAKALDPTNTIDYFDGEEFPIERDCNLYPVLCDSHLVVLSKSFPVHPRHEGSSYGEVSEMRELDSDSICDVTIWQPVFYNSGKFASIFWSLEGLEMCLYIYNFECTDGKWIFRGGLQM